MTDTFTAKKLLELATSVGQFTEIIQSDYLEPWQCYIIEAYKDPIFLYIKHPRTLIVSKEMYDVAIRYLKWRNAWNAEFKRLMRLTRLKK